MGELVAPRPQKLFPHAFAAYKGRHASALWPLGVMTCFLGKLFLQVLFYRCFPQCQRCLVVSVIKW